MASNEIQYDSLEVESILNDLDGIRRDYFSERSYASNNKYIFLTLLYLFGMFICISNTIERV